MLIFLGSEQTNKTVPLLQYTYDHLLNSLQINPYGIFITSKCSTYMNDMIFGRYDIVDKITLSKFLIKYIEKFEDLLLFFENLLMAPTETYPSIIAVDIINVFFNLNRNNINNKKFYKKILGKFNSILEAFSQLKDKIEIVCSFNLELYSLSNLNMSAGLSNNVNNVTNVEKSKKYSNMIFDLLYKHFGENIFYLIQGAIENNDLNNSSMSNSSLNKKIVRSKNKKIDKSLFKFGYDFKKCKLERMFCNCEIGYLLVLEKIDETKLKKALSGEESENDSKLINWIISLENKLNMFYLEEANYTDNQNQNQNNLNKKI